MKKSLFSILLFVLLIPFVFTNAIAELQIKIGGQRGLYFSGLLNEIDAGITRSIDGEVFSEYSINSKRAVVAVSSKNNGGDLVVGVFKDDKLVKMTETSASFGTVTIRIDGNEKSPYNFRGVKWGMNPEQVKYAEAWCGLVEEKDNSNEIRGGKEISYETIFVNANTGLTYGFFDNKLSYSSYETLVNAESLNSVHKAFKDHLTSTHGKASQTLVNGKKYDTWRDGSTHITLISVKHGEGDEYNVAIIYSPKPAGDIFKEIISRRIQK